MEANDKIVLSCVDYELAMPFVFSPMIRVAPFQGSKYRIEDFYVFRAILSNGIFF